MEAIVGKSMTDISGWFGKVIPAIASAKEIQFTSLTERAMEYAQLTTLQWAIILHGRGSFNGVPVCVAT